MVNRSPEWCSRTSPEAHDVLSYFRQTRIRFTQRQRQFTADRNMGRMRRIRYPILLLTMALAAGCRMPPASRQQAVSFSGDVYPILQTNCHNCHLAPDGEGYRASGLSMRTYADLMRGTRYGPVVVPGDSRRSILVMLVEGRAGRSMRMPHNEAPLDDRDIETLKRWIEQGAPDN
jgi:hypothetical protein